ncbi:ATP-binding protein, partial [Candidatus Gracilibacteria bacterium]|nr:ATP-binding protein [Candidatus Gracilibacteria bacterium]
TTFLEYFDGMKTLQHVLFVGATNNLEQVDSAIRRAGRFDMKLFIDKPDQKSREQLWKLYLQKAQEPVSFHIYDEKYIDLEYLAKLTHHFTGADIKEIIRRLMNDYSVGTLNMKDAPIVDPVRTFKGLLYHIDKYKEENAGDRGIIPDKQKLYLSDIGGQEHLKEEIQKLIIQIEHRQEFENLGVPLSKGIMLYGPPGTGKTLAAKVIANETDLLFYMFTAKDFLGRKGIEHFEKKLDELQSPSIVFIDEIDSIGMNRTIASEYSINILNTFLQKLDGFSDLDGIFFIGATNNIDIIDDALLRAGRFDRKIYVGHPDEQGRKAIFKLYIQKSVSKKGETLYEKNIDIDALVEETEQFVGADIKELIRRLNQKLAIDIITKYKPLSKNKISTKMILEEIKIYKTERNFGVKKIGFGG